MKWAYMNIEMMNQLIFVSSSCLSPSSPVQVQGVAGQLRDVPEGRPALRMWLVHSRQEVLLKAGVHQRRKLPSATAVGWRCRMDARYVWKQPLHPPKNHKGKTQEQHDPAPSVRKRCKCFSLVEVFLFDDIMTGVDGLLRLSFVVIYIRYKRALSCC